ncbi:DegT/DnrJ/EryC1/StrS family aminotransferase [Paenibacillus sp. HJGM_3]|uniref:DegT/DnrJ/EryC1/StrS family aminotransferase n=1 Tax=Paenibacillus sp. HJGM_3 TaxID=3379816 RepID=UPI00385B407C
MIPLVHPCVEADDLHILQQYGKQDSFKNSKLKLENEFADFLGYKYAIAVTSGTAALHLALLALGITNDDEVICPSYTCTAILNSILYTGAKPVFTDIAMNVQNSDFSMDLLHARANITERTKALIFTHMFGKAIDLDEFKSLNIPLIEDATLSLGAVSKNNRKAGSKGDISIVSLHESKMISAIAGGVLCTSNEVYYHAALEYLESTSHSKLFHLRYNYEMPPIHAALAINQLQKLPKFIERRLQLASLYKEKLMAYKHVLELPELMDDNIFFRYMVQLKEGITPESILSQGLEYRIQFGRGVYPSLHQYTGISNELFPNTTEAVQTMLSIPLYPALTDSEALHILDTLIHILMKK